MKKGRCRCSYLVVHLWISRPKPPIIEVLCAVVDSGNIREFSFARIAGSLCSRQAWKEYTFPKFKSDNTKLQSDNKNLWYQLWVPSTVTLVQPSTRSCNNFILWLFLFLLTWIVKKKRLKKSAHNSNSTARVIIFFWGNETRKPHMSCYDISSRWPPWYQSQSLCTTMDGCKMII
jgi:hypothetical protein